MSRPLVPFFCLRALVHHHVELQQRLPGGRGARARVKALSAGSGGRRGPGGVRPVRPGGVREWSFTPLGRLLHGLVAAFEG